MKWLVQRAGGPDHWMPGWFALAPDDLGDAGWFPTWREALTFALGRATENRRHRTLAAALPRWGITPTPARHGKPKGRPPALSHEQVDQLLQLRAQGVPVKDCAARFGVSYSTLYNYLKKVAA